MRKLWMSLGLALSIITLSSVAHAGPKVEFKTNQGNFVVDLESDRAPKTVNNFLGYVKSGFYNGTVFHRVINGFMVQGGGFTPELVQKPTQAPVVSEAQNGLKNQNYTIAMARTSFYINVKDNPGLDYPNAMGNGYTVFGRVISGQATIDKIKQTPTGIASTPRGRMADVPNTPVVIESATILK